MYIVSQKQQEIKQLKQQLFQLERIQQVEKQNQSLAYQLIENLKEENQQLRKRILEIRNRESQMKQIVGLKEQFDRLREKNLELEQKRSDLSSEIYNTRLTFDHLNLWHVNDLAQTHWDQHATSSRSESQIYRSRHSHQIAPNLIDSRYISIQCLQNSNEEQQAHPKAEYSQYLHPAGWKLNKNNF